MSTPTQTGPPSGITYVSSVPSLTTIFAPTPGCVESVTMLGASDGFSLFNNHPSPGPELLYTACHASEELESYFDSIAGTVSPGFSPLYCPKTHSVAKKTVIGGSITHGVCCPSSYSFHPNANAPSDRPFSSGVCYLDVSATPVLTNKNGSWSSFMFSTAGQAYGLAIDGILTTYDPMKTTPVTAQPLSSSVPSGQSPTSTTSQDHAQQGSDSSEKKRLALGLGLGLGIPVFLLLMFIGYVIRYRDDWIDRAFRNPLGR